MTWQPDWWLVLTTAAAAITFAAIAARRRRGSPRGTRARDLVQVVVALGLVLVALRPSGQHEREVPAENAVDLVVMLDRTASMGAMDHAGGRSRMEGAAEDLVQLVAGAAGAHVSVIVFDDTARLLVPATTDVRSVVTTLGTVGWRPSAKAMGSDVSVGVELAHETLTKLAAQRPGNDRALVYAGDGEQTQSTARGSLAALAELVDEAWVLGYGTSAGGVMPVAPGASELVSRDGVEQRSVLDEETLQEMAEELDGSYVHRTGGGTLPDVARPAGSAARELVPGADYYWVVALVLVPPLLVCLAVAVRRWRAVKEER
ncbi:vWA domain-containing protein [Nocardioides marmotae]|uniref:VWA domain-containing protein n=1 Tax=Nocardioides marmotae TaxID=2663857 RepID=A0A6I3J1W3_9ACTN|nr:VWA domain-containing protein [Nocardioides marmotae]MCR6030712.1 VWA domain-containing protein [Gordonia jinghuaiqii]MBC9734020.1 VWA domain-containing protein [Nocardioides marmotae]MTB85123.1 VWA domain-containing protein [Nocardioides marmotae]MTB94346.1 VWA domain-containing protein [Nocardioides marmotae]QKE01626.1 VWA domain-containing protein [Nocardioides marmotae]